MNEGLLLTAKCYRCRNLVAIIINCVLASSICPLLPPSNLLAQQQLTGQQIARAAKEAFLSRRESITYRTHAKKAWLEGLDGPISKDNLELSVVAENVSVNRSLDLTGRAEAGDLVKLRWRQNNKPLEMFFVYMGEERFPDTNRKQSFYIYPYRTQLEYNTFPARKHAGYIKSLTLDLDSELLKGLFLEADVDHGDTKWVKKDVFGIVNAIQSSTAFNGTAVATILRASTASQVTAELDFRTKSSRQGVHCIVFCARAHKEGTFAGHAWVMWTVKGAPPERKSNQSRENKVYGFYPSKGSRAWRIVTGTDVPGDVVNELLDKSRRELFFKTTHRLIVYVDEEVYEKSQRAIAQWNEEYSKYDLYRRNCTHFSSQVAKDAGIIIPSKLDPSDNLGLVDFPETFLQKLIIHASIKHADQ